MGCVRCWGVGCRRLPARDRDILIMYGGSVVWGLMFAGRRIDHAGDVADNGVSHDAIINSPRLVGEMDAHARHRFDSRLGELRLGARAELGVCVDEYLDLVPGRILECPVLVERVTAAADYLC